VKPAAALKALERMAPRDLRQVRAAAESLGGVRIVDRATVPGHDAPLDYLGQAYFEGRAQVDCLVIANRGGGKTRLAAVATVIDLLFKPGIQVRILGGSLEQSARMYEHLRAIFLRGRLAEFVEGNVTQRGFSLRNGSRVETVAQSAMSVRGQRIHRLRCDEVELFDPEVWEAAQMTTLSGRCGQFEVRGGIEALSTQHLRDGMVSRLIKDAAPSRRVIRWSVLDVLERCDPARSCASCPIHNDCQGRAKEPISPGHFPVEEAVAQRCRVSDKAWAAEMLCLPPKSSPRLLNLLTRRCYAL
jgi:hypothetical protein